MCRTVPALALVLAAGLAAGQPAAPPLIAVHGVDAAGYQKWVEKAKRGGFRPTSVTGYDAGGKTAFAAVAVKEKAAVPWEAKHGLTSAEYQKAFDAAAAKGFRPASVSGYLDVGTPKFAAVFVKDKLAGWEGRHDLTPAEFADAVLTLGDKKLRPDVVSAYADGKGGTRFAALFVPTGGDKWQARMDLTPEAYQTLLDELGPKGYRPTTVTAFPTPAGVRFAAALVTDGKPFAARHDLTPAEYQAEFDKYAKQGYRPVSVAGYWTGTPGGPEAFDAAMKQFMADRSIGAGTLAVSHNGKLVMARAYGFADEAKTRPVKPDDPFRLASVGKPITAAAVRKLAAAGKLDLDAKAFPYLGLKPLPGQTPDPRLDDVTVRQLLNHRGGWDLNKAFDPMFRPLVIAEAAGKPGPADPEDVIRYMMGQPLQFDPGSKRVYSNFGYCVLGRVIEKAAGKSYTRYVREDLLGPLGVTTLELGRTLPKLRNPREPVYVDPEKGRNVMVPKGKERVPLPDGSFHLEAMDSHGGLIASAPDLIRFLDAYWQSGEPKKPGTGGEFVHFGSLPGTWAMVMQRPNGVNVACLFNRRADPSGKDYYELEPLMKTAADGLTAGGLRYAAVFVK
jgi:N-acyl-D-amino-acid deacylase